MTPSTPEPDKASQESASQQQRTKQPQQPPSGDEQLEEAQRQHKDGHPLPEKENTITGDEESVV